MLAAFVRSEPAVVAGTAEGATRWWHLRWLVPLATAATAIAIWVAIPSDRPREAASLANRETAQLRFEPAEPAAPSPPSAAAEGQVAAPAQAPARVTGSSPGRARKTLPSNRGAREADRQTDRLAENKAAADTALRSEAAAPTAKAKEEAFRADAAAAAPAAPVGAAAAAPPAASKPTPQPPPAVADERRAAQARETPTMAPAPPAPLAIARNAVSVEITSPDPNRRWRIVGGTRIDYSTNAGAAWQPAAAPAMASLVGGHAPSATVAWVVGSAGTILVTTDGTRFEPVAFPEPVDLVAVVAVNEKQATVTSADGRRFHTDDRGTTWNRR